jgi:hypothetical protein
MMPGDNDQLQEWVTELVTSELKLGVQKNTGQPVKIRRVTWTLYVYCSTVTLEACDLVRLVWFLCDKSVKKSGDRLKRLEWRAL